MNLDNAQRQAVTDWIGQGLKLSDIQNKLHTEFGLRMTYMEVRLLVDDLKVMPKDVETQKTPILGKPESDAAPASQAVPGEEIPGGTGSVSVMVDQIARPGALASGKVTFSDGKTAEWQFDQSGRLGLVPPHPGYRPSPSDLQQFQAGLDQALAKMGF